MTTPLLTTKLNIPPLRPILVPRPYLIDKLNSGQEGKLTLVSSPAGFGKSTLISIWIHQLDHPAAWVSLDKGDNTPSQFLKYFISAIQLIEAEIGEGALISLKSSQSPKTDVLLIGLLNEIAEIAKPFIIVLDDYHVITESIVQEMLTFILENQPPQMHIVISSRADPPWPLARLRARGELTEIRTSDLRFTTDETANFLNDVMKLKLSQPDVASLERLTEGWIAGLQMAALSMQGRRDVSGFIKSFSGSHRFVLDYLVEEVLDQQSPAIQEFLLRTSILERLSGPLCNAVTRRDDSQTTLSQLESANLFVIPLDEERRWYRYHHLFVDLLRIRLEQTKPEHVATLNRKASEWFERNELIAEAVNHAMAANDFERVVNLLAGNALIMMDYGELSTLVGRLEAIPVETVHTRPWLCLALAWARVYSGPLDAVEPLLRDAEMVLKNFMGTSAEAKHINGHIAAIRAYAAVFRGDLPQIDEQAQAALVDLPEHDLVTRGVALALHATALRNQGDFTEAENALVEAIAVSQAAGKSHVTVTIMCDLAEQLTDQGQLRRAATTSRKALQLASDYSEQGRQRLPVAGLACTCLSHILREWNDLESALHFAREGVKLSNQWGWVEILVKSYIALARVLQAIGDTSGAFEAIEHARGTASLMGFDYGANLPALEARVHLLQGDVARATRWAAMYESRQRMENKAILSFHGQNLLWARILIAQGKLSQASKLLVWVLEEAEALRAERLQIVGSILQSIVLQVQGEYEQAMIPFKRALVLAEPEGYLRTFIDEGIPMEELLKHSVKRGIAVEYAGKLLEDLKMETKDRRGPRKVSLMSMTDPLSERELEILRLLKTHLSSTDIADELTISVNTVRTHIKSIYSKLNVHNRKDAVQRAQELDLL